MTSHHELARHTATIDLRPGEGKDSLANGYLNRRRDALRLVFKKTVVFVAAVATLVEYEAPRSGGCGAGVQALNAD